MTELNVGYPQVEVHGDARTRGRQLGEAVPERIAATLAGYREMFLEYAGFDWDAVREVAAGFVEPIRAAGPGYFEELEGMAEGAGVDVLDLVAANCRTEIVWSGLARKILAGEQAPLPPGECTAAVALPQRTTTGHTILAQNWDWYKFAEDSVVIITARRDDGPDYVTVVEAGLLAKSGFNEHGIGVVTNALVSAEDMGTPGLPYHVALRRILDARTLDEAANVLSGATRASSANYLIASADGLALDVECAPGGTDRLRVLVPEEGVLAHTNHFQRPADGLKDLVVTTRSDTLLRLQSVQHQLALRARIDIEGMADSLRAHANHPFSVCMHYPEDGYRPLEHAATIASVIIDLDERTMQVASGRPCESAFVEVRL